MFNNIENEAKHFQGKTLDKRLRCIYSGSRKTASGKTTLRVFRCNKVLIVMSLTNNINESRLVPLTQQFVTNKSYLTAGVSDAVIAPAISVVE